MKRRITALLLVLMLVLTAGVVFAKKPNIPPVPNPEPGQDPIAATPNLSFPVVMTDVIEMFYQQHPIFTMDEINTSTVTKVEYALTLDAEGNPIPIEVAEVIAEIYTGGADEDMFEGNDDSDPDDGEDTTFYYNEYIVGTDGCAVDIYDNLTGLLTPDSNLDGVPDGDGLADKLYMPETLMPMSTWLLANAPWYDQPLTLLRNEDGTTLWPDVLLPVGTTLDSTIEDPTYLDDPNYLWNAAYVEHGNSWQADWVKVEDVDGGIVDDEEKVYIDFIDWGNPLEANIPVVGQRFPVELAFYVNLKDETMNFPVRDALTSKYGESTSMTAFRGACLEKPSTRDELFGISDLGGVGFTKEIKLATVLTSSDNYKVEVEDPKGNRYPIRLDPAIGPSGKMNFASAEGGWTPLVAGEHRIWFHMTDPLISLAGADINDDDHYIMSTGCMAEPLNKNKAEMSGIIGNSTYIDIMVVKPNGRK